MTKHHTEDYKLSAVKYYLDCNIKRHNTIKKNKKYNLLFAISYNKIIGWILYEELKDSVKKEQLVSFYYKYIFGKYKNYLILMDNARPHKALILQNLIDESNNKLLYTVPYNPQTNPI